jgi:hypothetical protein
MAITPMTATSHNQRQFWPCGWPPDGEFPSPDGAFG